MPTPDIDSRQRTEIEAAVYRKMVAHFRRHPQVQNIDLMNLGYFCRNCFSKWYRTAAAQLGITLTDPQAREIVYGMPYADYQAQHQQKVSAEQLRQFEATRGKATE